MIYSYSKYFFNINSNTLFSSSLYEARL